MKKALGALVATLACVTGLTLLQWPRLRSQLTASELDPVRAQTEEILLRDRLRLLKVMPTLGFDNLIADWTFLNFFQYFGYSEARQLTGFGAAPEFFDVVITRDPYYRLPYQFLSSSVTLFAGQPEKTVQLLEKGLTQVTPTLPPDAFWLWRYKALDELLFLGDIEATIASLENLAKWANQSPLPDTESYAANAQRTANFLRQNPASRQVRASSWVMIWHNAINEDVRQYVQLQIEALGYQVFRDENRLRIEDIGSDSSQTPDN